MLSGKSSTINWRSVLKVVHTSSCPACQLAIWPPNFLLTVAFSAPDGFPTRSSNVVVLVDYFFVSAMKGARSHVILPCARVFTFIHLLAPQDLERVCKATGSRVQTSVNGITDDVLGTCTDFEERQVGDERYNIFTGCPQRHTSTIVLRGGAEQFLEESHRSIWGM